MNQEIYNKGTVIGVIAGSDSNIIESIVTKIAEDSDQLVDWHYFGGRARVMAMGDIERAKKAFRYNRIDFLEI